jgi:hypothetical protein
MLPWLPQVVQDVLLIAPGPPASFFVNELPDSSFQVVHRHFRNR